MPLVPAQRRAFIRGTTSQVRLDAHACAHTLRTTKTHRAARAAVAGSGLAYVTRFDIVCRLHSRIVASSEHESRYSESGENEHAYTGPAWPISVRCAAASCLPRCNGWDVRRHFDTAGCMCRVPAFQQPGRMGSV